MRLAFCDAFSGPWILGGQPNTSQIQHGFILFFNLSILLWLLLQADEAVDEAVADVADDVADASEAAAGAVG